MKQYNEEEKLTLLNQYITSGMSKSDFCRDAGISSMCLLNWQRKYGFPDAAEISSLMSEKGIPNTVEELQAELVRLRKEKKALERSLNDEKLKNMANTMLIDLAESTYHIRIRKNSVAK